MVPKPPPPPQGELATRKYSHHKFRIHDLQNLYTPMLWLLYNCITVYKYALDKYMLVYANKKS